MHIWLQKLFASKNETLRQKKVKQTKRQVKEITVLPLPQIYFRILIVAKQCWFKIDFFSLPYVLAPLS